MISVAFCSKNLYLYGKREPPRDHQRKKCKCRETTTNKNQASLVRNGGKLRVIKRVFLFMRMNAQFFLKIGSNFSKVLNWRTGSKFVCCGEFFYFLGGGVVGWVSSFCSLTKIIDSSFSKFYQYCRIRIYFFSFS